MSASCRIAVMSLSFLILTTALSKQGFTFDMSIYEPCYISSNGFIVDKNGSSYNPLNNPWHYEDNRDCLEVAFKASGTSWDQVFCSGLFPEDTRFSKIIQSCQTLSKPLRRDTPCELKDTTGNTIATRCDEFYAITMSVAGKYTKISRQEMLERMFANKQVITVLEETSVAQEERTKTSAFKTGIESQSRKTGVSQSNNSEKALRFIKRHYELSNRYPHGYIEGYIDENKLVSDASTSRQRFIDGGGVLHKELFDCTSCDFSGMDLRKSVLGFQIDFSFSDLSGAKFTRTWLDTFHASDANLSKADFQKSHIARVALYNSNLAFANFSNTRFPEIDIRYSEHLDRHSTARETEGISFTNSNIDTLRLSEVSSGPQFQLSGSLGSRGAVKVPNCHPDLGFDARNLIAGLRGARLGGLGVTNMLLQDIDFSPTGVAGLSFRNSVFTGSIFKNLRINLSMRGQEGMSCSDFKLFDIFENADFTDARLTNEFFNEELVSGRFGKPKFCRTQVKLKNSDPRLMNDCQ